MGASCSKKSAVDTSPSERIARAIGLGDRDVVGYHSHGKRGMEDGVGKSEAMDAREKLLSRDLSQKSKSMKSRPVGYGRNGTIKASSCWLSSSCFSIIFENFNLF